MFLYSNLWQIMAVKQFSGGVYQEVGNTDTFDVIQGSDMKLQLNNVTDTDGTRFRCTFLSSFSAPKSIIRVQITGKAMYVWILWNDSTNYLSLHCVSGYTVRLLLLGPLRQSWPVGLQKKNNTFQETPRRHVCLAQAVCFYLLAISSLQYLAKLRTILQLHCRLSIANSPCF